MRSTEIQKYKANTGILEWSRVARKFASNDLLEILCCAIKRLFIQTNKKLCSGSKGVPITYGNTELKKLELHKQITKRREFPLQ